MVLQVKQKGELRGTCKGDGVADSGEGKDAGLKSVDAPGVRVGNLRAESRCIVRLKVLELGGPYLTKAAVMLRIIMSVNRSSTCKR